MLLPTSGRSIALRLGVAPGTGTKVPNRRANVAAGGGVGQRSATRRAVTLEELVCPLHSLPLDGPIRARRRTAGTRECEL